MEKSLCEFLLEIYMQWLLNENENQKILNIFKVKKKMRLRTEKSTAYNNRAVQECKL